MIYLVCGPPCAGKNTWVDARFQDGDIVVDFDALTSAFSRRATHYNSNHVRFLALAAWRASVEVVVDDQPKGRNVYVIATLPEPLIRQGYIDQLKAQLVLLDPGEQVCIARAQQRPDPDTTTAAIRQWYQRSTNPQSTRKYCAMPGCSETVEWGKCERHRTLQEVRRGSSSARGYGGLWERRRYAALSIEQVCVDPFNTHGQREVAATDRDHIIPKSMGGSDEDANLWFLCHACHSRKTAMEMKSGRPLFPERGARVSVAASM